MNIERKNLKSVSEFSAFKVLLITYLIFFILYVIFFGIIFMAGWAFGITDMLQNLGFNINDYLGEAGNRFGIIAIVGVIVGGLVASVFYAAFGTLIVWIMNVILKISGGVELRFAERVSKEKAIEKE